MTAPGEIPGAAPARGSGPSPARAPDAPLAAELERERVRDPDALPGERASPEPPERLAGQLRPITPDRAAENFRRLAAVLREVDTRHRWRGRPIPALAAPMKRASLQSARSAAGGPALTSTT